MTWGAVEQFSLLLFIIVWTQVDVRVWASLFVGTLVWYTVLLVLVLQGLPADEGGV